MVSEDSFVNANLEQLEEHVIFKFNNRFYHNQLTHATQIHAVMEVHAIQVVQALYACVVQALLV